LGRGRPGAEAAARTNGKLTVESVKNRNGVAAMMQSSGVDIGEAEAIVLAQESKRNIVFLDDRAAVLLARSLGLEVVRTPAVYGAAKKNGLIEIVRPKPAQGRLGPPHCRERERHPPSHALVCGRAPERSTRSAPKVSG